MDLELLRAVSFWVLIIGLALEVAVAVVAFIITHKDLSKKKENTLKHWLEACAILAGLLVLIAIIGEHKVGKLDAKEKREANERIEKLEARARHRRLTPEQRLKFKEVLQNAPKRPITIYFGSTDNETGTYAGEIRSMLDDAGYS